MAKKKLITADQIQQGDKLRVIVGHSSTTTSRRVVTTYEGVAAHTDGETWRTEGSWNLYVNYPDAKIYLLDRPKPKPELTVPTLPNAVVKYTFILGRSKEARTAVRDDKGTWRCYQDNGSLANTRYSDESFEGLARENGSFEVVFGGVAK